MDVHLSGDREATVESLERGPNGHVFRVRFIEWRNRRTVQVGIADALQGQVGPLVTNWILIGERPPQRV